MWLKSVYPRYLELSGIGRIAGNFAILTAACSRIGSCPARQIEYIVGIDAELHVLLSNGPEPFEERQIDILESWVAFCAVMGGSKCARRRFAVGANAVVHARVTWRR